MGMFDYFIERVLVHEGGYVNDPRGFAFQARDATVNHGIGNAVRWHIKETMEGLA